jgi:hypothetical protein
MNIDEITNSQWKAYKKVKNSGLFNMFTPDAIDMSGLDKQTFITISKNYNKLEERFESKGSHEKKQID